MSYASLGQLKAHLRISDATDDTELQAALDAARAQIDQAANRGFDAPSAPATERVFAPWGHYVSTADVGTKTDLVVTINGTVQTLDEDVELTPRNADALGMPWTGIRISRTPVPRSLLPPVVSVTAQWGWPGGPPAPIVTANVIQAARLFARRLSPFGIAGSPEMGNELRLLARLDPDVDLLVAPYVRHWGAV